MAKKSRRQRKLAKQRETRKSGIRELKREAAQIVPLEEPKVELERAEKPPASAVKPCVGHAAKSLDDEVEESDGFDQAVAHELDDERALDFAIARLYRRCMIGDREVDQLAYEVSLQNFVRRGSNWSAEAKTGLRRLERYMLWTYKDQRVTPLGEEVWNLFRHRIRRDSALLKIKQGRIRSLNRAA